MNRQKESYNPLKFLSAFQGFYYIITGLWPIVHMPSFLAVTGLKIDLWLVETVAVLVLVIGIGLLIAARRSQISFPLSIIAAGSAFGLSCIDVIYVWQGEISVVYLLDAILEIILLVMWITYIFKSRLWDRQSADD